MKALVKANNYDNTSLRLKMPRRGLKSRGGFGKISTIAYLFLTNKEILPNLALLFLM